MPGRKTGERLCLEKDIHKGKSLYETYRKLLRKPKYMCGRVAADDNYLCYPEKL